MWNGRVQIDFQGFGLVTKVVPLGHHRGEKPFLRCPLGLPCGDVPGTVGFAGLEPGREVWVGDKDLDKSMGMETYQLGCAEGEESRIVPCRGVTFKG